MNHSDKIKVDMCAAETILDLDNIIFDFEKIITKPVQKYVHIITTDYYRHSYPIREEFKFNIESKEDAYRIIKEFIISKENSPELIFQTGFCEKFKCVKWLESDTCCKHRIASFNYNNEECYTRIIGYSDLTYEIQITL
jgi:hypothetical protein